MLVWHVISCYVSTFTTRQLTLHAYVSRSLMHPFIFLCIGPSLNYHIILLKHWKTQPSSPSCLIHSNLPKATDLLSVHRGELPESSPCFSWLQRYISVRSSFSVFFPLIDFLFCILSWGRNGISIHCWSHRWQGTIFRWEIGYFPTWFRLTGTTLTVAVISDLFHGLRDVDLYKIWVMIYHYAPSLSMESPAIYPITARILGGFPANRCLSCVEHFRGSIRFRKKVGRCPWRPVVCCRWPPKMPYPSPGCTTS